MPIKLEVLSPGHVEAVQVTLNGPHTQFDVSEVRTIRLHLQPQSHFQFFRNGDDLLLQMHDGAESILLIDYFEDEDDIPELQFLAGDQSCFLPISFVNYDYQGLLIPEIGQAACSNEGFAVPPLLLLGLLGAGVAAAAVIGDDDDGGGSGGGGTNPPPDEAPEAPVVSAITEDLGSDPSDGITNDNTLFFSGTGVPGAIVVVYLDGEEIGSTVAAQDGSWSYDHTGVPLADGVHQVTAAQKLGADGELSELSDAFRVEIDTNDGGVNPLPSPPPVITHITEDNGHDPSDGVTNDNTLFFSGTGKPHATVTLFLDGEVIGTALVGEDGTWQVDHTDQPLPDGRYVMTATQEDRAGNPVSAPSDPFDVVIDTNNGGSEETPAPIVTGITDDNGESDSDGITDDNTLEFHGIGEANALVFVYLNGVEIGSIVAGEDGLWTLDHTGVTLADGEYAVTARQVDAAGNDISPPSEVFDVVIDTNMGGTVPTPAPVITGITEDDGHDPNDGITKDDRLFIHGTGEPGAIVTIFMDGVEIGSLQVDAQGEWNFDYTNTAIPEGTYDLTASQRDLAGNDESETSDPFTITIDTNGGGTRPTQPPMVTGITDDSGVPDDGVTNDNTLFFHGTAEPNALVFVYLNGRQIGSDIADADGNWTYDHTEVVLRDGPHVVTATQQDAAGNDVSDESEPFDIYIDSGATGPVPPPVITHIDIDSGHSDSDGVTMHGEVDIHGVGRPNAIIYVRIDGQEVGSVAADANGAWVFPKEQVSLGEGPHVIEAQQQDLAGNDLSPLSDPFDVVVDSNNGGADPTQPPVVTAITEDSGDPDGVTNDNTLVFHGTSEPFALVMLYIDGTFVGTGIADENGEWDVNHTQTALADGTYAVTATQQDQAGNAESGHSDVFEVVIDTNENGTVPTPPPVITGITEDSGDPDGVTNDNRLIFHGTSEPNATIELFLNGVSIGTEKARADGTWDFSHEGVALADGAYEVTATQRDLANNDPSAESAPFDLLIDTNNGGNTPTQPPIVDGIRPDDGRDPNDGITGQNVITVYGRSDEPDGAVVTVTIEDLSGNVVATLTAVVQGGTWETEATQPLADGDYDVSATQRDLADNPESVPSASMPIIIDTNENGTVPTAPPVVVGIRDDTGAEDGYTSDDTLFFYGTGERFALVTVYLDGTAIGSEIADANGDWVYDHTHVALPEATYQVTATQQDAAHNPPSGPSDAFELTIDKSPIGPPTRAMDAGLDVALFAEEPLEIQLDDDGGDIEFPLEEVQKEPAAADDSGYEFYHAGNDSSASEVLEISRLSEI